MFIYRVLMVQSDLLMLRIEFCLNTSLVPLASFKFEILHFIIYEITPAQDRSLIKRGILKTASKYRFMCKKCILPL